MYNDNDRDMMMKTARASGAVGAKAVLPRVVEEQVDKHVRMLDYGAGPEAIHTKMLREKGFNVLAHDINPQRSTWHIDPNMNHYQYFEVLFASNVINVQPTKGHVLAMLANAHTYLARNGVAYFNYPTSPRKSGLTVAEIDGILKELFIEVQRVTKLDGKKLSTPVWKCKKKG